MVEPAPREPDQQTTRNLPWYRRIVHRWATRKERLEDRILSKQAASEEDEQLKKWLINKRQLNRDQAEAEAARRASNVLRVQIREINDQISELASSPVPSKENRKLQQLERAKTNNEDQLKQAESRLEHASKRMDERNRDIQAWGLRNMVGRSAQIFRHQFAAASGVIATLTVASAGLLATTTGAGNWTNSHMQTLVVALAGIAVGLTFHAIPLCLHLLDWRLATSGKVHPHRGSHAAGRDKQVVNIQAVLLGLQVIAWLLVVIRIFRHLGLYD